MTGEKEGTARGPVLRALAQVIVAGCAGSFTVLLSIYLAVAAAFGGGSPMGLLTVVVLTVGGIGLLFAAASIAPEASWLTWTKGARLGWAVLVGGLGTAGLSLGGYIGDEAGLDLDRHTFVWLPLSIVPFALVAGMLLRRWYLAVGSLALTVATAAWLLAALATTVRDQTEVDIRLAGQDRSELFVTEIPGYRVIPQSGTWQLQPSDPAAIPPPRYIWLHTFLNDPTADCEPNPRDAEFQGGMCTVERPGLTYTQAVSVHGYFLRAGSTLLQIVGSSGVDRNLLRDAIVRAAPSADPAIYTVDIPGYTSTKAGDRQGISFAITDKSQTEGSRYVHVRLWKISTAGECAEFAKSGTPSPYLECADEGPDLHYRRMDDRHIYLHRRGAMEVQVIAGLGVARDLLRDAALAARPATDDELLTMLPAAAPPRPEPVMDSVKKFAKRVFG